jgi:exopolyphosphatase/guanosine-5'-triphosphate,3'-diphosphate pyrophosphatase
VTRVAAIDLGTNSTRLLVADVEDGRVAEVVRRAVVTALGEGVDRARQLGPAAVARVHEAVAGYRREADELGAVRVLAAGTSAVRDAANGVEFLAELGRRFGLETRLLGGDEEAALTRLGVGPLVADTLLLDVGGGSTELTLGGFRVSLDVGSLRLIERFLRGDPPARGELDAAAAHVRSLLPPLDPTAAVGVAATIAQLDRLLGRITLPALEAALARIASLPLAERRLVPGLDPERARVIVGGALIVAEVLRRYGLPELAFSRADLLDGVVLAAAART